VVVFEAAVGALVLLKDPWGPAWSCPCDRMMALLIPFLSVYGVTNAVLAASMLPLLARSYDESLRDLVARMWREFA
jgi:hypothetical protein